MASNDGPRVITGTADTARVEAPVTVKAYLICAFAAFGGIFFGYDTGWMSGVLGRRKAIREVNNLLMPLRRNEILHPPVHWSSIPRPQ